MSNSRRTRPQPVADPSPAQQQREPTITIPSPPSQSLHREPTTLDEHIHYMNLVLSTIPNRPDIDEIKTLQDEYLALTSQCITLHVGRTQGQNLYERRLRELRKLDAHRVAVIPYDPSVLDAVVHEANVLVGIWSDRLSEAWFGARQGKGMSRDRDHDAEARTADALDEATVQRLRYLRAETDKVYVKDAIARYLAHHLAVHGTVFGGQTQVQEIYSHMLKTEIPSVAYRWRRAITDTENKDMSNSAQIRDGVQALLRVAGVSSGSLLDDGLESCASEVGEVCRRLRTLCVGMGPGDEVELFVVKACLTAKVHRDPRAMKL